MRTNANTSGRCERMTSLKSFDPAVKPVTAVSAPGSLPTVLGTTSSRRTASDRSDAASVPVPFTPSETTATVLSGLISTLAGALSSPVAIASFWSASIAAFASGEVTSSAFTTTSAGICPPGKAACILS